MSISVIYHNFRNALIVHNVNKIRYLFCVVFYFALSLHDNYR